MAWLARNFRRLRSPWGCLVLALLLAADVTVALRTWRGTGPVGLSLRDFRGLGDDFVLSLYLVREEDGGLRIVDESQSVGMLADLSQRAPERIVSVSYWRGEWKRGLLTPWVQRRMSRVLVWDLSTGAAPASARDVAAARRAMSDALLARMRSDLAHDVDAGDYNTTTPLWWGMVHDGVALAGLAVVLSCVLLAPGWWRSWRRSRGLGAGRCPSCRYDLRGCVVRGGRVVCPECGASWEAALLGDGRSKQEA